ncbi:Polymerase/histidinol phosphatase-like protein [Mortierella sp. GBAus27b]|nr:hypothetical protein BGX31_001688 [Mortierella sp. GBA43]KAI8348612.1 Polymerase/histidinol phosphatase-like protein [Mortierella sp. GBAus27b]
MADKDGSRPGDFQLLPSATPSDSAASASASASASNNNSSQALHKSLSQRSIPPSSSSPPLNLATAQPSDHPPSSREHGSKASQLYHKYILTPCQSFKLYLSTPDREAHAASFPRPLRYLPPWLLPRYQGKRRVIRSTFLRPLCRLIILAVILTFLIASTILYSFREGQPEESDYSQITDFDWTPTNPRSYLSPWNASFGAYDVLLDGHSHSTYSDGRMSPETLIKWHIAQGFNAAIVSDHNTVAGGLAAQKIALAKYADQFTVIPAMELTCCRLHMNLIGINETIDFAIKKWPTDDELKATIDRAHELGGLAIINHIPWSNTTESGYHLPRLQNHPSREQLVAMGIDGFEVENGGVLDAISLKFAQDNNLLVITGADVHYPTSSAFSWTILNTNGNRTAENIMAQLKARRTSFLFDPTGTQNIEYPPENPNYVKTAVPTNLGLYFQMFWFDQTGMYSFSPEGGFCHQEYITIRYRMIGYFLAWVLVGFLFFEAGRLIVVGCIWGPCQRRKKYIRKEKDKMKRQEEGLTAGRGDSSDSD